MKKYNLSKIMKRAWELVKKAGLCISEGLKLAWKEAKEVREMKFERGQIYQNEELNIFIKSAYGSTVKFIEGYSPAALNDMQELPVESLVEHIKKYGYKRVSPEMEAFVNGWA
jgi:hypothetical protein